MKELTKLQHAIMLSFIMGTIMSNYDVTVAQERTKPINTIRKRIKKFMFQRSRKNETQFIEAIKHSDAVWKNSVNHFTKHKMKIDAVSTVIRLYDLYADVLSRYVNLHEKQMEAYAYNSQLNDTGIEHASYEVSDYILDELSIYTGVKRKKLNLLKRNTKI